MRNLTLSVDWAIKYTTSDKTRAINEFEYAITLDEKYFSPYLNMGSIYTYYETDPVKALEYYNRGLKLKITGQERDLINSEIEKIKAKIPISN